MRRIVRLTAFAMIILLLFAVGSIVGLTYLQARVLVRPARNLPAQTPADLDVSTWEEVTFETTGSLKLEGWFIPPDERGRTLILVHGLAGNRGNMLEQAALLHQHGYGSLLFDLRNHGTSEGDLTTLGYLEAEDVVKAFAFARTLPGVDPERIGLIGESMGGAAVLLAATQLPDARLVVVQSTFTSLEDNVADNIRRSYRLPAYPLTPLHLWFTSLEGRFPASAVRPIDVIASISPRPLLIMHSDNDPLFPMFNPERLYAAARDPKQLYIMPMNGHGGLIRHDPDGFGEALLPFLDANFS